MPVIKQKEPEGRDIELLYKTVEIAEKARAEGNHPFGALLADGGGNVLLSAGNTAETKHCPLCHAETNLMFAAAKRYPPDFLASCSLYTSVEPCIMCTGAAYWANVRRIVFGISESSLLLLTGNNEKNPTFSLSCAKALSFGQKDFVVAGPAKDKALIEAILRTHKGFWEG